jgi:hypothetical protein
MIPSLRLRSFLKSFTTLDDLQRCLLAGGIFWQFMGFWVHREDFFIAGGNFDSGLNFTHHFSLIFGSDIFWTGDGIPFLCFGMILCLSLFLNVFPRASSAGLLVLLFLTFYRNNILLNLGSSIATWLLLHRLLSEKMSPEHKRYSAYIFTCLFYTLTGFWKFTTTSAWTDGTMLERLAYDTSCFHGPVLVMLKALPLGVLRFLTLMVLYGEMSYFLSIFISKTRPYFWYLCLGMHVFLMVSWPTMDISFTLIALQLASYPPRGITEPQRSSKLSYILCALVIGIGLFRPAIQAYHQFLDRPFTTGYFDVFYSYPPPSPAILMFSNLGVVDLDTKLEAQLHKASGETELVSWAFFSKFKYEVWNANYSLHRLYWSIAGWQVKASPTFQKLGLRYIRDYFCHWTDGERTERISIRLVGRTDWVSVTCPESYEK